MDSFVMRAPAGVIGHGAIFADRKKLAGLPHLIPVMKEYGGNRKAELAKGKDILVVVKLVGGVKIDIRLAAKGSDDAVPHVALSIEIDMSRNTDWGCKCRGPANLSGRVSAQACVPPGGSRGHRGRLARNDGRPWVSLPDLAFAHDGTDAEDAPRLDVH